MPKTITITKTELAAALRALNRTGPILSAHKRGGYIVLHLCGDKEPLRWKPATSTRGGRPVAKRKPAPKPAATSTRGGKAKAKVKKP